jgi:hypothetical protein
MLPSEKKVDSNFSSAKAAFYTYIAIIVMSSSAINAAALEWLNNKV